MEIDYSYICNASLIVSSIRTRMRMMTLPRTLLTPTSWEGRWALPGTLSGNVRALAAIDLLDTAQQAGTVQTLP